jgi:hypothetical protein
MTRTHLDIFCQVHPDKGLGQPGSRWNVFTRLGICSYASAWISKREGRRTGRAKIHTLWQAMRFDNSSRRSC